ncbi:MAG TPA: hypothetical protein VF450_01555, partial [Noviherbaspirillum sp.]
MKKTTIAKALSFALLSAPLAAMASEAELMQKLEAIAAELEKVKAELAATKHKAEMVEKRQEEAAPARTAAVESAPAAAGSASGPATVLTGYGEVNYNRPTKDASQSQVDVRRAVIGIQHRFDDRTKLVSEFEWEHAV